MRLALSSEAAPGAALADLVSASTRRGLSGVELLENRLLSGHHETEPDCVDRAMTAVRSAGGAICGILAEIPRPGDPRGSAEAAARLGAPLIVPWSTAERDVLAAAVALLSRVGARMLLAHPTDPAAAESARDAIDAHPGAPLGLAWDVRPGADDQALFPRVLEVAGDRLEYVRFHGGGPESERQTGQGVGALMARLTLARYQGPIVLTPSDSRYHQIWRLWLGRGGGWGCGSKKSDESLVILDGINQLAER